MKTQLIKTLMVAVLVLCGSTAQAQAPIDDCPYPWDEIVDCTTATDDPICDFQKQNGLATSGRCDRAMALKLAEKFPATQGAWTTVTDAQSWAICSATGPRRKDGKCGWFRIVDEATPGGSDEDPIEIVRKRLATNAKATERAYVAARKAGKDEADYECKVNDVLGLPCLQLVVFGPAAGTSNLSRFAGLQLALHLPFTNWPYRSGLEFGVTAGWAGDKSEPGKVHLLSQVGPFGQGVVMPWRRVGFLVGAQYDHLFPGKAVDTENYVGGRFGVRFYLTDRLALDFLGTAGGVRKDNASWDGAGGGAAALQVHF